MKKVFFATLTLVFATVAFTSCGKDDKSSPSNPTDYYQVEAMESYGKTGPETSLTSGIKNLYVAQLQKVCTTQNGFYVSSKSESEIASSFSATEVEAQTLRDKYDWEGTITITIVHITGESTKDIYSKDFNKTDNTTYTLVQTIEVSDSLCVGLDATKLATFREKFNKAINKTVIGKNNITNAFAQLKENYFGQIKAEAASFAANQAIVVFLRQTDSASESAKRTYYVASKDSSATASNATVVKEMLSVIYRFECETDSRTSIWSSFYRNEILKFMESTGGSMKYMFTNYCQNPIQSDSLMKAKMDGLEADAIKWHKDNNCSKQCSITVFHHECFFDKNQNDTIYHHVFPAETAQ